MNDKLIRPFSQEELVDKKRTTCWNRFEDVCMRHMTFRKSPNQPESVMKPFYPIIRRMSKRYYYLYNSVYVTIGYDSQDLESYGRLYLINFLGMKNTGKSQNEQFKLFTVYIKQRYRELSSICNRKNKNILGSDDKVGFFETIEGQKTNQNIPDECIYNDPGRFGFRRVSKQEFLDRVKSLGGGKKARRKAKEGMKSISIGPKELHRVDIENTSLDYRDNEHLISPERALIRKEENYSQDPTGLKKILDEMDPKERMALLKKSFKNIKEREMKKALKLLIKSYKEINCG